MEPSKKINLKPFPYSALKTENPKSSIITSIQPKFPLSAAFDIKNFVTITG